MAIYQGGNTPLVITLPQSLADVTDVSVMLSDINENKLKAWKTADLTISGTQITAPMTQQESAAFPVGKAKVLVKWMDPDTGEIIFGDDAFVEIERRSDRSVVL